MYIYTTNTTFTAMFIDSRSQVEVVEFKICIIYRTSVKFKVKHCVQSMIGSRYTADARRNNELFVLHTYMYVHTMNSNNSKLPTAKSHWQYCIHTDVTYMYIMLYIPVHYNTRHFLHANSMTTSVLAYFLCVVSEKSGITPDDMRIGSWKARSHMAAATTELWPTISDRAEEMAEWMPVLDHILHAWTVVATIPFTSSVNTLCTYCPDKQDLFSNKIQG